MSDTLQIPADLFRHKPVGIQIISSQLGDFSRVDFQTRHIQRKGVIVEIVPPLSNDHPFLDGVEVEINFSLPAQAELLCCRGVIQKVVEHVVDQEGHYMSLVGIRFKNLDISIERTLEAHDLIVQTSLGRDRSMRIPVQFRLEVKGMDVLFQLNARDLSMTGMFIEGQAKFPLGKVLVVSFRLPFQKKEVSLKGKVVWQGEKKFSESGNPLHGFGFHFEEIPDETNLALATYCSKHNLLTT